MNSPRGRCISHKPKRGRDSARIAFAGLARQYGATRAAWIASSDVPAGLKPQQWSHPPITNVLPERWIVIGYQGNAAGQVLAVGPAIKDSLQVGPSPTSSGTLSDPEVKWIIDFNTAIQAGMAFSHRIDSRAAKRVQPNRGAGLENGTRAARLSNQAWRLATGASLLGWSATACPEHANQQYPGRERGFSPPNEPTMTMFFALEQGPSLCPSRPTGDGDRLARALNIAPAIFSHVKGANGSQDEVACAMNTVMWPATWGYYLSHLVNGSVPNPDVIVPAARDHFAAAVRAARTFSDPAHRAATVWNASGVVERALEISRSTPAGCPFGELACPTSNHVGELHSECPANSRFCRS